jgi:NhaP-type Na+/H+ and K+/H+ antiporter
LFLVVGFAYGALPLPGLRFTPDSPVVEQVAELALFATLVAGGLHANIRHITSLWRLPGRALFFGMPITAAVIAACEVFLLDLSCTGAVGRSGAESDGSRDGSRDHR